MRLGALILGLFALGCATATQLPSVRQPDTRLITQMELEPHVHGALRRMWEAARAEWREKGACLYGRLEPNGGLYKIRIQAAVPAAVLDADSTGFRWGESACADKPPDNQRYLGRVHAHIVEPRGRRAVISWNDIDDAWARYEDLIILVVWDVSGDTVRVAWQLKHGRSGHFAWVL